jgi:predicted nucleic acid-binding protein
VIYVDASVVLAQLLSEDRLPATGFWESGPLVSSRLLEYETWTRINAMGLARTHGDDVRSLLARLAFLELASPVLARALDPFPRPVRTLDALHLASVEFLRGIGQRPALATFDARMADTARALDIPLADV